MINSEQHTQAADIDPASRAKQAAPFMYAIMAADGAAHIDENCVAENEDSLWMELNYLNDSPEAGYSIVPLFVTPPSVVSDQPFQHRVQPWIMACFGAEISADGAERNHRFLEESLELVQACGCTASEAYQLVDYVYGRPVGERAQEVGGVMVTLAALCLAQGLDMHAAGDIELARIWTKVEAIRAKQAAKPKHSPLPAAAPQVVADDGLVPLSVDGKSVWLEGIGAVALDYSSVKSLSDMQDAAAPVQAQEPVAHLKFWAAQSWSGNGNHDIDCGEGLEVCEAGDIGADKFPAFPVYRAPVQPVAVPDGFGKAFITLESNDGRYSIVMKFNQRSDAFAVHDFLLDAGGKDYNLAAPAAQPSTVAVPEAAVIKAAQALLDEHKAACLTDPMYALIEMAKDDEEASVSAVLLADLFRAIGAYAAAPAAQGDAVSDTGLPELREHLKIASVYGSAVTLSSAAAAALYHAMTTGKPQGDAKATS